MANINPLLKSNQEEYRKAQQSSDNNLPACDIGRWTLQQFHNQIASQNTCQLMLLILPVNFHKHISFTLVMESKADLFSVFKVANMQIQYRCRNTFLMLSKIQLLEHREWRLVLTCLDLSGDAGHLQDLRRCCGPETELGKQILPGCFCVNWNSYKGVKVLALITALVQKANPFMKQQKANSELLEKSHRRSLSHY